MMMKFCFLPLLIFVSASTVHNAQLQFDEPFQSELVSYYFEVWMLISFMLFQAKSSTRIM